MTNATHWLKVLRRRYWIRSPRCATDRNPISRAPPSSTNKFSWLLNSPSTEKTKEASAKPCHHVLLAVRTGIRAPCSARFRLRRPNHATRLRQTEGRKGKLIVTGRPYG